MVAAGGKAGQSKLVPNAIAMPHRRNGGETVAVKCQHCGRWIPTGGERCQHCGESQQTVELRPLGGAPAPPPPRAPHAAGRGQDPASPRTGREPPAEPQPLPPDQEDARSWRYIGGLARADPALAVLLALMAISALASLVRGDLVSAMIQGAILWGVLTFQWWGYFIALALAALSVVAGVGIVAVAIAGGAGLAATVAFGPTVVVGVFTLIVLLRRRDSFA